ncbi:hypothetical protein [Cupriavidus sp. TMH.W2]|uniref:hypothetical protein n=1 Tax=Cupriavidus sp. TMH.W2 TaxID=3434465 RepID=UPI003D77F30D
MTEWGPQHALDYARKMLDEAKPHLFQLEEPDIYRSMVNALSECQSALSNGGAPPWGLLRDVWAPLFVRLRVAENRTPSQSDLLDIVENIRMGFEEAGIKLTQRE